MGSNSNSNSLDPSNLVDLARSLVAQDTALTSPTQALALLLHSIHSALSFRLVSPSPLSPPTNATERQGDGEGGEAHPNRLPEGWPQQGGELKFRYKHHQSSLEFVITVVELGDRALVAGAAVDNPSSSSTFDLLLRDYFSPTSLSPSSPLTVSTSLSPTLPFSAPHRLADLILLYRLNVLQKLIPGLRKDGYEEVSERDLSGSGGASGSGAQGGGGRRQGAGGGAQGGRGGYLPDRGGPMGMFPPGRSPSGSGGGGGAPDNDPLRIPGSGGRGGGGFGSPLAEIGRRDLDPLGGMGGTFGGGLPGGLGGFGGFGGGGGGFGGGGGDGGGMFMGPDHPLFRERFGPGGVGGNVGGGGEGRRWGGDGYLPPGGAPPGARFDPVGPVNGPPGGSGPGVGPGQAGFHPGPGGGAQGQGQGQGGGPGGLGGRGGGGGRGVHPDLERPGGNSDYDAMFG
ncbi:hypothetical protein JCM11251_001877 [Rhodosporidiobolus azoricus]